MFNTTAQAWQLNRRQLLSRAAGMGVGAMALEWLLAGQPAAASTDGNPLAARPGHFAPRAKHIIFMHMVGAPSQLDLFDFKPTLQRHDGQLCPQHLLEGQRFAFLRGHPRLMGTRYQFHRHGESGLELSELLPHLGAVADDLTLLRSLHTEPMNHAPAQLFLHTGFARFGRPSFGSWVGYGLGSENADLPAYVVLMSGGKGAGAGNALFGNGFLPSVYQGIEFRNSGDPVLFLSDPQGLTRDDRRRQLNHLAALNEAQLSELGDPEIATRIAQYEMAFRMQVSVPELMDVRGESADVLSAYGATPGKPSFANNCLLARRLVERGVRFVQLFDSDWDMHGRLFERLPAKCREIDQPLAALVTDLKQRGLLDDTLIVWGGEFGRTPMLQGTDENDQASSPGRDHHVDAFSMLMAGGGLKPGATVGTTDELGYKIAEDPVHVNDFHATLLHLLGLDHQRLTYRFQGRNYRLTDVAGKVVDKLLA